MRDHKVPTFVLGGPHIGNFDLFGMTLCWLNVPIYVLAYPNPNNAYKAQTNCGQPLEWTFTPFLSAPFEVPNKRSKRARLSSPVWTDRLKTRRTPSTNTTFFWSSSRFVQFLRPSLPGNRSSCPGGLWCQKSQWRFLIDSSKPIVMEARPPDLVEEGEINVGKVLREARS